MPKTEQVAIERSAETGMPGTWKFMRRADGSVVIQKLGGSATVQEHAVFAREQWAGIVSAMALERVDLDEATDPFQPAEDRVELRPTATVKDLKAERHRRAIAGGPAKAAQIAATPAELGHGGVADENEQPASPAPTATSAPAAATGEGGADHQGGMSPAPTGGDAAPPATNSSTPTAGETGAHPPEEGAGAAKAGGVTGSEGGNTPTSDPAPAVKSKKTKPKKGS